MFFIIGAILLMVGALIIEWISYNGRTYSAAEYVGLAFAVVLVIAGVVLGGLWFVDIV